MVCGVASLQDAGNKGQESFLETCSDIIVLFVLFFFVFLGQLVNFSFFFLS